MTRRLVGTCILAVSAIAVDVTVTSPQGATSAAAFRGAELAIGVLEPSSSPLLAALNPISLAVQEPRVPLGEYHWTAAVSPDRSRLALSTGGPRGGIHIFGLPQLEPIHRIHPGIAPEALAWLSPTRLAAALLCNPMNRRGGCAIVLADPGRGQIVRRWPESDEDLQFLPFQPPLGAVPKPVAVTPHGVVFLLAHVSMLAPARVVVITPSEELRSLSLARIELGVGAGRTIFDQASGGLAVDPRGDTAFVVGTGRTVAEIDLKTMTVRYHEVSGLRPSPDGGQRAVIPLEHGRLAVFGEDFGASLSRAPAGVTVIDTDTWRAWTVDSQATRALFAADTLLVYGGRSRGVTGYSSDGRQRFRLFGDGAAGQSVNAVHAHGRQAYVAHSGATTNGLAVIDAVTGAVMRETATPLRIVDFLHGDTP